VRVTEILEKVDRQEFQLPELQRGYVWSPRQVRDLVESLYKDYPVGQILLWLPPPGFEAERPLSIESRAAPLYQPKLVLDGQQRITSLHRLARGRFKRENKDILFNVNDDKFQVESPATRAEPLWVSVTDVLQKGAVDTVDGIGKSKTLELDEYRRYLKKLNALEQILGRDIPIQDLAGKQYSDVCQIFKIVNSKGTRLRAADLFLAELILQVPKRLTQAFDEELRSLDSLYGGRKHNQFDTRLLARCFVAVALGQASFPERLTSGIDSEQKVMEHWKLTHDSIDRVVNLIRSQFNLFGLLQLPSVNALVPLIAYEASKQRSSTPPEERRMLGWLVLASIWGRYSGSAETEMNRDVEALANQSGGDPFATWLNNLRRDRAQLKVDLKDLEGKGAGSPFLLASWVVIYRNHPRDWFGELRIEGENIGSKYQVNIHHIFPKALLHSYFKDLGLDQHDSSTRINDVSNLAFIIKRTNVWIGKKNPSQYFHEYSIGNDKLAEQFVPDDPRLLTVDSYDEFPRTRRARLTAAINEFLEEHLPEIATQRI